MIYQPIVEKKCSQCIEWLPDSIMFFKKDHRTKTGLTRMCKGCAVKSTAKWQEAHYGYVLEKVKKWSKEHPKRSREIKRQSAKRKYDENPEKFREKTRQRRINHPEAVKASAHKNYAHNQEYYRRKGKTWRIQHPERVKELNEQWRKKNSQKYKEIRAKATRIRRARKANAPGEFTVQDIERQYQEQNGRCFWCSEELLGVYDPDHLIPLSRNGTNWPDNIVISCKSCNQSKKDRLPFLEWTPKHPLKSESEIMQDQPILVAIVELAPKHR